MIGGVANSHEYSLAGAERVGTGGGVGAGRDVVTSLGTAGLCADAIPGGATAPPTGRSDGVWTNGGGVTAVA